MYANIFFYLLYFYIGFYRGLLILFIFFYFEIFKNAVMAEVKFMHLYSSLQCHMIIQKSLQDANLVRNKHYLFIYLRISLLNFISLFFVHLYIFFLWNHDTFSLMNRKFKRTAFT